MCNGAWYVETRRLLLFVSHAVNEIDEIWQQISLTWVVRPGRNLAD